MEVDIEKTKISYFHHWLDGEGMSKIESSKNKKILISQVDYYKLEEDVRRQVFFRKDRKLLCTV